MRVGIDARFFGSVGKGLGRYTAELIRNLERVAPDGDEFVVFLRKENFNEYDPVNPRFTKVLADYPWYSFREQIRFPLLLLRYRFDLVHFPHFNVPILYCRPFVVTIHDLILLRYPTVRNTTKSRLTYRVKFLAYRIAIGSAVRRARRILTVSRFTEKDIISEYPKAVGKIFVAYEGCDMLVAGTDDVGHADDGNGSYHGILEPYFLYVGNAYPHKNLEAFIPLAKRFPGIRFVLVGKEDHFYRRFRTAVEHAGVDNIVFAGFVPDGGLAQLYRNATGYVFPSLYEGFGLPPLEAMRFGIPVVAAKRGSIPEILGDAALYFDPDHEEDLFRQVGRILAEPELVSELRRKGTEQASLYHWEELAKSSLLTYHEAVE
ncbi:MAG: glycosyltransferase family 4 protein [Candidatus Moranbacteria bacterium]|nr:glycosyltransferase family 4 protein [Candidatus Moranbacteria bacterium]